MKAACIILLAILFSCHEKGNTSNISQLDTEEVRNYILKASKLETPHSKRLLLTDKAYKLAENYRGSNNFRKEILSIADLYIQLGRTEKAINCLKKVQRDSQIDHDTLQLTAANHLLGRAYMFQSKNDSAYIYISNAIKVSREKKYPNTLLFCYLSISELYYYTGDYIEVEKAAMTLIKYARQFDNRLLEHLGYNWLAISANELGNYIEANQYYNKSLTFFKDDPYYKAYILHCMGFNFYRAGDLPRAISFFKKGLAEVNEIDQNPEIYARLLDDLAHINLLNNKLDSVRLFFIKSEKIRDVYGIDAGRNYNKLYLSEYYAKIGDTVLAIESAAVSLKISEKFRAPRDRLSSLKQLLKIDRHNALVYSQRYIALSDSLQLAERRNRNKFARIAFEADELTVEKDRAIKQKWIVIGIAGTILLLGGLLFVIKMQRARQKRLILVHEQQKADEAIYQLINDQQLKIDQGRQAEKQRIARELHDGIMNRLASTRLNLFILNKNQDDETIKKCIGFIDNIQEIEYEIRQVAHDLNHEIFSENKGFAVLLETLFEAYRGTTSTNLFTEIDPAFNWEMTESVLRMNIYRILQEALQNSYKYAAAKNIFVTLTKEDDFVRILVHDDGIGFKVAKAKKGLGLQNIADRAKSLHGEFSIISGGREGTILNVLLPLTKQEFIV